jgi:hypothetical protein
MAVDKTLVPLIPDDPDAQAAELEIDVIAMGDEAPAMTINEDGSVEIEFGPESAQVATDHSANLAEFISDGELTSLANDLVASFEADKDSRSDWEKTYIKGLDLLGLKIEDRTEPWPGACGVFHPLLTEAVVRFQAQAITEIFPAQGPVRGVVIGKHSQEKDQQALRVQDYMNYLLTERMTEYRPETEKMLFSLCLAGSAFRKVYFDPQLGRPVSMFVPAEDLVVSYGASDLDTAERVSHVMRKTRNDIRKLQVAGFYLDIDLSNPSPESSDIRTKEDQIAGFSPSNEGDNRFQLIEVMVDLDLPGFEDQGEDGEQTGIALPYVVTIDRSSRSVLAIRRNWNEDDPLKKKRDHFVHYRYLPGMGFYAFGLIHLIGGLAKSATSILRQLVDAGTLSNLPGGLKARGLRIKGDNTPIAPGEFRDVDVPGGSIRDNITFLPYKEPSAVLYSLLNNIIDEGRRFASLADMKVADMNAEAPVGTTLAILERTMKVMSAIQARLHASLRQELKLLSGIIKDYDEPSYPYEVEGGSDIKSEDFDDRIDVVPVSDPNANSMAQRIMQSQAALQLSTSAPQLYDMKVLHRQMLESMGIKNVDEIIKPDEAEAPLDPVQENMNIVNVKPIKAFSYQDHAAHIAVHTGFSQSPAFQGLQQSPMFQSMQAALDAHVREHIAFQYRLDMEKQMGIPLPSEGEILPQAIEKRLTPLIASAAQQLSAEQSKIAQMKQNEALMQDPILQQKEKELQLRQMDLQRKAQEATAKMAQASQEAAARNAIEMERIRSQERIAESGVKQRMIDSILSAETDRKKIESDEMQKGVELGIEAGRRISGE